MDPDPKQCYKSTVSCHCRPALWICAVPRLLCPAHHPCAQLCSQETTWKQPSGYMVSCRSTSSVQYNGFFRCNVLKTNQMPNMLYRCNWLEINVYVLCLMSYVDLYPRSQIIKLNSRSESDPFSSDPFPDSPGYVIIWSQGSWSELINLIIIIIIIIIYCRFETF